MHKSSHKNRFVILATHITLDFYCSFWKFFSDEVALLREIPSSSIKDQNHKGPRPGSMLVSKNFPLLLWQSHSHATHQWMAAFITVLDAVGSTVYTDDFIVWDCMVKYGTMNTVPHNQHNHDVTWFLTKFLQMCRFWVIPVIQLQFLFGLIHCVSTWLSMVQDFPIVPHKHSYVTSISIQKCCSNFINMILKYHVMTS